MHLLAQPRIRKHLDHVDQPTAGPRQPVFAFAGAVETPHDRDLWPPQPEQTLAVVQHQLHLGSGSRLTSRCAAEDHVLHRLAPDRHRRLFAERPQHRVGYVRLARSVGAHDHAHAGPELEHGAVGEGLKALQRQRLQVHKALFRSTAKVIGRIRACRANGIGPRTCALISDSPALLWLLPALRPSCCDRSRAPSLTRPRRR